jgi:hypothetical protein
VVEAKRKKKHFIKKTLNSLTQANNLILNYKN